MLMRLCGLLLLTLGLQGCIRYEYEHEFWIRVDGSGTVYVTGRPELWTAFKSLGDPADPQGTVTTDAARALFERSGLRVKTVRITERRGHRYLFVAADFDDVNRLTGSPAFPDLLIALQGQGEKLDLSGAWAAPTLARAPAGIDTQGLMAVRFHLPSKVYAHKNASGGVERGNIVGWSMHLADALRSGRIEFGAEMDRRSILLSTVGLFAGAIVLGLSLLGLGLYGVVRRGRRALAADAAVKSQKPEDH